MSAPPYMNEDDHATTVMDRSALPPQSGTRIAHSVPPRDTVVDAPSAWSRAHAALGAALRSVRERFRKVPFEGATRPHFQAGGVIPSLL